MINSHPFKTAFISTLIFFTTIISFLITDYNTKNINFRNSPSVLKIENVYSEYYNCEILGKKFTISPTNIDIDNNYKSIIIALIPKKIKLIESFFCYAYSVYNDCTQYQKNIDYLNNINK